MTSGHHEDQGFPLVRDPGRAALGSRVNINAQNEHFLILTSLLGPMGYANMVD